MRTPLLTATCLSSVLLAACSSAPTNIAQENTNPLTASRYGEELADNLADLIIQNDPIVEKPGMREKIQSKIEEGKSIADAAHVVQDRGMMGAIIPLNASVTGFGLYVDDTLWLSSDFSIDPSVNLHVYLTTIVDPRDQEFPDPSAVDLGVIQAVYGPSGYEVARQEKPELFRTLVFFDPTLNRLSAFAQLSTHAKP